MDPLKAAAEVYYQGEKVKINIARLFILLSRASRKCTNYSSGLWSGLDQY